MKAMIKLLVVLAMIILMAERMLAKFLQAHHLGEKKQTEMSTIMVLVMDRLFYIDARNGINANFETGIVSDDGFGSVDTVLNFERVYGSYHDDIVQLSHDIYRGYTPLYGNDTVTGPSTQETIDFIMLILVTGI